MESKNYEYSAFISYKHDPDEKTASLIQYQIEHYTVPKKWRDRDTVKGKHFKKVFRDSTELSGHHDLTEAIQNALDASEFLVVVISRETNESIWVSKEIEYFLKNHDREHIITVLSVIDDPSGFYPELLIRATDGEISEPISVDYRSLKDVEKSASRRKITKKLYKDEFPRVAAPMLGVSYDDIKQRLYTEKKRKVVTIFALVFSVLLISLAYVTWSVIQIKKNYNDSVTKQASIYADQAIDSLETDERLEAMKYALQAVPGEGHEDMPVIPKARRALSLAVKAYSIPGGDSEVLVNKVTMTNGIDYYISDETGEYVLCSNLSNMILLKDTITNKKIFEESFNEYGNILQLVYYKDDFYVLTEKSGEGYNILKVSKDGTILPIRFFDADSIVCKSYDSRNLQPTSEGLYFIGADYSGKKHTLKVYFYNPSNDEWNEKEIKKEMGYISEVKYIEENKKFIFTSKINENQYFVTYAPENDSIKFYESDFTTIEDLIVDNDIAYITGYKDDGELYKTVEDVNYYESRQCCISAIDLKDGSTKWEADYTFDYHIANKDKLYQYNDGKNNYIISKCANHIRVYNDKNGNLIESYDFLSGVTDILFEDDICVYLRDGSKSVIDLNEDSYPVGEQYKTQVLSIQKYNDNKDIFIRNADGEIMIYKKGAGDDTFIGFDFGDLEGFHVCDTLIDSNNIVLYGKDINAERFYVVLVDKKSFETKWITEIECDETPYEYKLALIKNRIILYDETSYDEGDALVLYKISLDNGEVEKLIIMSSEDVEDGEVFSIGYDSVCEHNNSLYFWSRYHYFEHEYDEKSMGYFIRDRYINEMCYLNYQLDGLCHIEMKSIPEGYDYDLSSKYCLDDQSKKMLTWLHNGDFEKVLFIYDFDNEEWVILDELKPFSSTSKFDICMKDGVILIEDGDNNEIIILDSKTYKLISRVDKDGISVVSYDLTDNGLYVFWFDGTVSLYDLKNGKELKSNNIMKGTADFCNIKWYYSDDSVIIHIGDYYGGNLTALLDKETLILTDVIYDDCFYYSSVDDLFLVRNTIGEVGVFKSHSLEDLVNMAETQLPDED